MKDAADDNAGDADAEIGAKLDRMFRREAPRLIGYFKAHAGNHADALDLTQQAFLQLATTRIWGALRNPDAYLQRIARNLLFNRHAQNKRWAQLLDDKPIDAHHGLCAAPTQTLEIEAQDMMRRYREAVDSMSPKTRKVFLLHRVANLTYVEIADRMNLSVKTVEYHIASALKHLAKELDRE